MRRFVRQRATSFSATRELELFAVLLMLVELLFDRGTQRQQFTVGPTAADQHQPDRKRTVARQRQRQGRQIKKVEDLGVAQQQRVGA